MAASIASGADERELAGELQHQPPSTPAATAAQRGMNISMVDSGSRLYVTARSLKLTHAHHSHALPRFLLFCCKFPLHTRTHILLLSI